MAIPYITAVPLRIINLWKIQSLSCYFTWKLRNFTLPWVFQFFRLLKWKFANFNGPLLGESCVGNVGQNTGSRSTFEFTSRVNLSGPNLYCTTDIRLIKQAFNRNSRCNKVDADRLYSSYRLNLLLLTGQRCVKSLLTC